MNVVGDALATTLYPAINAHMGESVIYAPKATGVDAAINALRLRDAGVSGQDAPDAGTRMFLVRDDDVAQPASGDRITDSDGTWRVQSWGLNHRPGDWWRLTCSRAALFPAGGPQVGG